MGLSHVALDVADDNNPNDTHYVNSDATALVAKSNWDFTFSTITPTIDEVVNVTGLPSGTEVFMDGVSQGTMSNTTLTLTVQEGGEYEIVFKKLHYVRHFGTKINVKRYGE